MVVLQICGEAQREGRVIRTGDAGEFALGAVGLDLFAVSVGELWAAAGLCDLCGAGLLHSYDCGVVCAASGLVRRRCGRTGRLGYPVLPGLYIVMAVWDLCSLLLRYKPQYTWPGLIVVLLGVPVYLVWRRHGMAVRGKADLGTTGA